MDVLNACMHLELRMKKGDETVSACLGVETLKERARNEGREEGREEDIKNLMETLGLTFEQAMSALRISEIEQGKYRDMLSK